MKILKSMKPFDGTGDVGVWLGKLQLTAKILGHENVAAVLPLLLEGPAYAVYSHMEEGEKTKFASVEKALLDAFAMSSIEAYELLQSKRWTGEPVDVFLSDLQNLAERAGVASEMLLKMSFIVGLPSDVSSQLRAATRINTMSLAETVSQARALLSNRICSAAFVAQDPDRKRFTARKDAPWRKTLACWTCGEVGHLARNCERVHSGNDKRGAAAPATSR